MKIVALIRTFFLLLLLFPFLYFLISHLLIYLPCRSDGVPDQQEKSINIYLYAPENGFFSHSELIVPLSLFELSDPIIKGIAKGMKRGYLALSYGDRAFMEDEGGFERINYPLAIKALLLPTPSLMKVALMRDFDKSQTVAFALTPSKAEALRQALLESFQLQNAKLIPYKSPKLNHAFDYYEAKVPYNLFYTCNSWSGRMLWRAGVCVSPWTPLGYQLRRSIRREEGR